MSLSGSAQLPQGHALLEQLSIRANGTTMVPPKHVAAEEDAVALPRMDQPGRRLRKARWRRRCGDTDRPNTSAETAPGGCDLVQLAVARFGAEVVVTHTR